MAAATATLVALAESFRRQHEREIHKQMTAPGDGWKWMVLAAAAALVLFAWRALQ